MLALYLFSALSAPHLQASTDCDKCCYPNSTLISSWDFNTRCPIFINGPDENWFFFEPLYRANDGVLTCGPNGGLLNSNPFTQTPLVSSHPYNDNTKWLGLDKYPKVIPLWGQLCLEWEMSARVFNTIPSPFPDNIVQGPNDFRFGCGSANAMDLNSLMSFGFFITNDRVYIVYGRLPTWRSYLGPYAAFSYVIPVANRRPSDFHKLKIVFDQVPKAVRYFVGNKMVWEVFNTGFYLRGEYPVQDMGGYPTLTFPEELYTGFGTFTAVDYYPASTDIQNPSTDNTANYPLIREALTNCANNQADTIYNPVLGQPSLASYWDPVGTDIGHHIWGQGVEVRIKKMEAYAINS